MHGLASGDTHDIEQIEVIGSLFLRLTPSLNGSPEILEQMFETLREIPGARDLRIVRPSGGDMEVCQYLAEACSVCGGCG